MTEVGAIPQVPDVRSGTFRRLVGDGRFRRLWSAQFVSGIGDWLIIGLLMPMVSTLSGGSSFAVAGIMIAKIIPALLFSSVTGVLVDRFDRRRIMIAADVIRFLLVLILLFTNSLFAIYLVVLLMETASLFFWPARNALIPSLVENRDVTSANGIMYTTQQTSMLIGLGASGAILAGFEAAVRAVMAANLPIVESFVGLLEPALLGPRAGFFLNAGSFVFSALVITSISVSARVPVAEGRFTLSLLGRDVLDSFRFLRGHRELRGLLVTIFLAILGGGAIIPVGLDYVNSLVGGVPFAENVALLRSLTATPQTFMLVFMAAGMVLGALFVPRLEKRVPLQLLFAGSVALFGGAMFGFASVNLYWVAGVFASLAGACIAMLTVAGNSYVAHTTADEIRGRVFTALESVVRVALLLSMVVMAPMNDLIGSYVIRIVSGSGLTPQNLVLTGPRVTLQVSAGIVLAAAVYGFVALRWRECEDGDPGCEGGTMSETTRIDLPASRETLAALTAGDEVRLYGDVFTARDATHVRIRTELERDGELPHGLAGQTLFYAGPTPPAAGRPAGAVGPTTAKRMDAATPALMRAGIVASIGKGARCEEVREACIETGGVYFAAVGGAAALLATFVTDAKPVAYAELGTEALVRMRLEGFPVFVAIDTQGRDLYREAPGAWRTERGRT